LNITASRHNLVFGFICILIAVLITASAEKKETVRSQDIPLLEVVNFFDFEYQFSSTIGTFEVEHGDQRVVFALGSNEVFTGNRIVHLERRVELLDDLLVLSPEGVDILIRQLTGRPLLWSYDDGEFTVSERNRSLRNNAQHPAGDGKSLVLDQASFSDNKSATTVLRKERFSPAYEIQTIVIDAGHGGKDPGGIGYDSIEEKDIVLGVARELKKELKRRFRDKDILLIRRDDIFLSLEERGEFANGIDPVKNPLFISIHANVSFAPNTKGYESYFLSIDSSDEKARDVALRENSVLQFEVENYDDHLIEIINRIVDIQYRRESMLLADYIQAGLEKRVGGDSENRGVKSAFFYVLKASKMPAVLVEIGFVTNEREAENMLQKDYQRRLARGISDGIEDFIRTFHKSNGFTEFNPL
jgi:N-acetylmuramoyl-L-alanine amidase